MLTRIFSRSISTQAVRMSQEAAWKKLVTPYTHPSFSARMADLDNKLMNMKNEISSAPTEIKAVDWAAWESQIQDKALLQSIRKEYEAWKVPEVQGIDVKSVNESLEKAVKGAEVAAAVSKEDLPALREQLTKLKEEKSLAANFTFEEWLERIPGLDKQLRHEYEEGFFLVPDAEERLEAQDLKEVKKVALAGGAIPVPEDVANHIGDFVVAEELKKAEAKLDKMFGGSPIYEADKAASKAAAAKAAHKHH